MNRIIALLTTMVMFAALLVAAPAQAAAPCVPEYCVPNGVTQVVEGTPDTVYRIRFVAVQNDKVIKRFTAGPYFDTQQVLRKEEQLRTHPDARNLDRFRIDALSPGLGWEPAFR